MRRRFFACYTGCPSPLLSDGYCPRRVCAHCSMEHALQVFLVHQSRNDFFFLQGAFPLTWISATAFGWVFAEAMKDSILTGMLLDSGSDSIKPLSYHLWTEYTRIRCFVLRHSVQVLPACQKSSTYPSRNQRPNTTGRRRLACTCALFCELAAYTIHQSHLSCSAVSRTCPHVPLLDHGVSVLTVTGTGHLTHS